MNHEIASSVATGGSSPGDLYLQLQGITKSFGRFVALTGIDLTVMRGEFVCFLGPSGCGKTTLLRIIAGLEEHDRGVIIQAGKDVSRLPASKRDFGIVFQSYALFPNLTVRDNVAYGLQTTRMRATAMHARADELLALVGLSDQRHKYPAQLSGGQQQRVALARALAPSPSLLLLDEPLSALDARVRAGLRSEITDLQARLGVTTIMVTHDQIEALTMADRIVVMDQGRIVQVGPPQEIYERPATPFVADFVGAMNFLPAVLESAHTVRIGAQQLAINGAAHAFAPGSAVRLSIRPEEVELLPLAQAAAARSLAVDLTHVEFLGSFYRLTLTVSPVVGTPPAQLVVDLATQTARRLGIAPDAELRAQQWAVQFPHDRVQVYPDGTR